MGLRETAYEEMASMTAKQIESVYNFILFEKYRAIHEMDDSAYLSSIPGMMESIREGIATPVEDCVGLSEVWPDV